VLAEDAFFAFVWCLGRLVRLVQAKPIFGGDVHPVEIKKLLRKFVLLNTYFLRLFFASLGRGEVPEYILV